MQAPGTVTGLGHVIHRTPRHVRRLGILLRHPGRLARMAHRPAGGERIALALRCIGVVVPGIVAGIALLIEPHVVTRIVRLKAAIRPHAVQPIVALVRIEAAFGDPHADDRLRIDAEPLHAFAVRLHMGLADQNSVKTERTQIIAHGHLAHLERKAVPGGAVRGDITAGIEAHARGAADRRLHIGAGEAYATRRQRVDIRGLQRRMARAGQVVETQLVAHDEEDVLDVAAHGFGL